MPTALITGITGQDGSYLAEFLLSKGYEVHGIIRRSSSFNTGRIEHLYLDEWVKDMHNKRLLHLHYGDMTDSSSLIRVINLVKPDEIYNLAAQSHVKVSFDVPEYTADADCWKLSASSAARSKHVYTRHLRQNFLARYKKFPNAKPRLSIRVRLIRWQSYMLSG